MSCLADVPGRLLFSEGRQKGGSEGVGGIEVGGMGWIWREGRWWETLLWGEEGQWGCNI